MSDSRLEFRLSWKLEADQMGHQVTMYVTPTEVASLEEAWRQLGPMTVLHRRSPDGQPRALPSSDCTEDGQRWLFFALVQSSDLKSVSTRSVPAQGYWAVDSLVSPVVEFTRCFFDQRILRRGRLYFVDGYYDADGRWIEKSASFMSWAKDILSVTKKKLIRRGNDYIGPQAQAWLESSGGQLVQ